MTKRAIAGCLPLLATLLLLAGCAGTPPDNLGVRDGRLAPCPPSPNCVSSQATDDGHRVAPLRYTDSRDAAQARLREIIESSPRARVVTAQPGYLRAEFTSRIPRFVDDVEFWFPREPLVHVRSASRLGHSDFGVNRARVEEIRSRYEVAPP